MTTLTALPMLPPAHHWRRKINAQPHLTPWIVASSTERPTVSVEVGNPNPGDIVLIDGKTLLFLGEAPEVTRTRALLIGAHKMAVGEALDTAVARLIK